MKNTRTPQAPARAVLAMAGLAGALLMTGCALSVPGREPPKVSVYQSEKFQAEETFSRLFDATMEDTCEAARRALLSQGYLINPGKVGAVSGTKKFQPEGEVHIEINFNVVCVPDGRNAQLATAFVSAQQDRYAIKKSANSTSIGVSAIGSISVPMSASQDSMVKVASETIPAGEFYDRFFALMHRMVTEQAGDGAAGSTAAVMKQR